MRQTIPKMLAMLLLFVIGFSSVLAASAQTNASINLKENVRATSVQNTPTISIRERLPDGEYIVVIDNVEQRTITPAHARDIAEGKAELNRLRRAQPLYEGQVMQLKLSVDLAKKDAQLATTQAALERERAEKFQALFNGEQALRLQAESLMRRGRVSTFFDNPYVQIGLKVGVPFVQTILTARRE